MNKFIASTLLFLVALMGMAQSKVYNATNYGSSYSNVYSGNATGASSLVASPGMVNTRTSSQFIPFLPNEVVTLDKGLSTAETLTVVPTNCFAGSLNCTLSATFAYKHGAGSVISSGTFGLQEAINQAMLAPDSGTVLIDSTWQGPAGSSLITAAVGSTRVVIQDNRSGTPIFYQWNGSAYAPSGGGGGTSLLSAKVVYTSKLTGVTGGVAVVPGSSATGTTDSAAVINAAIAAGNVDLEVDSGYALSASLVLSSNTTIHCIASQYGFIMQMAANAPVLINAHTNAPTTTNGTGGYLVSNIGDSNISVIGCQLNANSTQAITGTNNRSTPHSATPGGLFVGGVEFYAVNGLTLKGNEVYDSGNWAVFGANDEYVRLQDNYLHQPTPTVAFKYTAGYQFDGPDQFILASGNRINAGDDSIAFNADDGNITGSGDPNSSYIKSFVKWGNETDLQVSNETLVNTSYGVRLLSTNDLIDRVQFTNINGQACGNTGTLIAAYPGVGPGNLGTIRFDGWNVATSGSCNNFAQTFNFNVSSNIQSLQLNGVQLTNPGVNWPVITQTAGTIGILSLRDWDLNTQSSGFSNVISTNGGTIGQLAASGINWHDNAANTSSFFSGSVAPGVLTVSNYVGPNRLLASGYVPRHENGDAFTNTYPAAATIYVNTTFKEQTSGTALAASTPATCANGCTGTWTASSGGPASGAWAYSTNSASLIGAPCAAGGTDTFCPVYINSGHSSYTLRVTVSQFGTAGGNLSFVLHWTNNTNFTSVLASGGGNWYICDVVSGTTSCSSPVAMGLSPGTYTTVVNGNSIQMTAPGGGTISYTASGSNTNGNIGLSDNSTSALTEADIVTAFSVKSN